MPQCVTMPLILIARFAIVSPERGSFRRAPLWGVEQSTQSRGMRNLEHRLGPRFERGPSGTRPAACGHGDWRWLRPLLLCSVRSLSASENHTEGLVRKKA